MPLRLLLIGLLTLGVLAAAEQRDPWAWPFARHSIWNTPRGDAAVLVPAQLPPSVDGESAYMGVDVERHVRLAADDPVRPVYPPSSWSRRWPGDSAFAWRDGARWSMPVADAFRLADAAPPHTPNACVSFLMPDGRELRQLEPTCRLWDEAVPDRRIVGWPAAPADLYDTGTHGAHWGSGLSVLGGSLRVGELTGSGAIRHALKLNVWGRHLFHDDATGGYRWPADRADSYAADGYRGSLPALRMGALLSIPSEVTAADLQVTSPPGRKILVALQEYGCYISDDSGWNAYDFCAEDGVADEAAGAGFPLTGRHGQLVEELRRLVGALCVVDDNSADTVGGAGNRLAPPAPRLVDPAWAAPTGLVVAPDGETITLAWHPPTGWSADVFELERQTDGGAWQAWATSELGSVTDTAPPDEATVAYRIRGVDHRTGNAGGWATSEALNIPGDNRPPQWDQAPVADPAVVTGSTTLLSAAATDPDEEPLAFHWSVSGAPAGAQPTLEAADADRTMVSFSQAGTYRFTLEVADPHGASISAACEVTVLQVPVAVQVQVQP